MGETNNNAEDDTPWESASNDRAFREQTVQETQPTGEPSSPAVTCVRWDIDEDNSNNNDNNNNNTNNNANDVSFLTSETAPVTARNAQHQHQHAASSRRRGSRKSCYNCNCNCLSKCSLSHFLHVWDMILTIFWMVLIGYHLYYNKDNEPSRSTSMAILLVICIALALLNALRGFLWVWASLPSLSTICCCGCCFEDDSGDPNNDNQGIVTVSKFATNLTLWLGIVYGSVSVAAWFGPSSWLPWCDGLGPWCSELIPTQTAIMPIALTAASVIELVRWIFLQGQLSSSSSSSSSAYIETTRSPDYYNDDFETAPVSPSESSRHRPWWFNRHSSNSNNGNNDGLRDPLLESSGETTTYGQPSWAVTSWIPFRSPSRNNRSSSSSSSSRNNNNNNDNDNGNNNNTNNTIINGDEEDVGSVLDSLGEDWASRAESDPYWWTR